MYWPATAEPHEFVWARLLLAQASLNMSSRSLGMPRQLLLPVVRCGDGVNEQVRLGGCAYDVAVAVGSVAQHGTCHVGAVAVMVLCIITARTQTEEAQVDADGGKERMPVMWSWKSGCMLELFTPLSSPVSATVTMMPLPSRPDHDVASMLAMLVLLHVSSTFMTWMPFEFMIS